MGVGTGGRVMVNIPNFRVWYDEKLWVLAKLDLWGYPDQTTCDLAPYFPKYSEKFNIPLAEVKLMQSTGLKDKNGVDIFEGDILLHTSSSVNYSDIYWHSYVQVYRMDSGAYRIKGKHIYDTELMSARNRLEIVGNIYQNQNLLDKEYFSTSDGIVEQADEN